LQRVVTEPLLGRRNVRSQVEVWLPTKDRKWCQERAFQVGQIDLAYRFKTL